MWMALTYLTWLYFQYKICFTDWIHTSRTQQWERPKTCFAFFRKWTCEEFPSRAYIFQVRTSLQLVNTKLTVFLLIYLFCRWMSLAPLWKPGLVSSFLRFLHLSRKIVYCVLYSMVTCRKFQSQNTNYSWTIDQIILIAYE